MPKPDKLKFLHKIELTVRWGDMDALGHVNNTTYFRYMEQARIDWICNTDVPLIDDGIGLVIVTAECNYKKAITYPATVTANMFASEPGRSSFKTWYEIRDKTNTEALYADGSAVCVWVNHKQGRSLKLPETLRSLLVHQG